MTTRTLSIGATFESKDSKSFHVIRSVGVEQYEARTQRNDARLFYADGEYVGGEPGKDARWHKRPAA